jgi:hypothetical protein
VSFVALIAARATAAAREDVGLPRSVDVASNLVLHRGAETMTLVTAPPRLLGLGTDLSVEGGRLAGVLDGGRYDVTVTGDHALGSGPRGRIDVALRRTSDRLELDGTWNGRALHLALGPGEVRGTVVRPVSTEGSGVESCRLGLEPLRDGSLNGPVECLGHGDPLRMSLDPVDARVLTDTGTALLLVAFIASPPVLTPR